MTEAKTRPSGSSVDTYLASRASAEQLADCKALLALLAKLGKHRFGKACLYFKRLADLDQQVLEQLVVGSLTEIRRRHG